MKLGDAVTGQVYSYTISPPSFTLYQIDEADPAVPTFFKFTTTQTNMTNQTVVAKNNASYMYWLHSVTNPVETNFIQMDLGKGLWATPDVKQFWIHLSSKFYEISPSYCNASLIFLPNSSFARTPFPPSLECEIKTRSDVTRTSTELHKISLKIKQTEVQSILSQSSQALPLYKDFGIRLFLKVSFYPEEYVNQEI